MGSAPRSCSVIYMPPPSPPASWLHQLHNTSRAQGRRSAHLTDVLMGPSLGPALACQLLFNQYHYHARCDDVKATAR